MQEEKEADSSINSGIQGAQYTSKASKEDGQSKESVGEITAISKRKPSTVIEQKASGPSKLTVLIEGIEALGKPPVTKQDLHKLFKPFNVDYNNIVVKNNKDCAFVEVKPDKCKCLL